MTMRGPVIMTTGIVAKGIMIDVYGHCGCVSPCQSMASLLVWRLQRHLQARLCVRVRVHGHH